MPQQAAGTRIEPAVSVPKATSASLFATATALPDEDPPGISIDLSGFLAVPKYSFKPAGATANSLLFVFPTIWTFWGRAVARHAASDLAGLWVKRKKFDPAVVTTPFMSMLSLIASRRRWLFSSAPQCLINARSPGRCLVNSGTAEHPLSTVTTETATRSGRMPAFLNGAKLRRKLSGRDMMGA